MQINPQTPILVTGANGYVASWVVKKLLDEGLTVHATVRNPDDVKKVGHLKVIDQHTKGTLKLFKADLLSNGDFDAAMAGCELVFHTASPFAVRGIKDAQKQLIEPAKKGTDNVLQSANRTSSVKRVVLTSSVAAIYGDTADIQQIDGEVFTEEHWNFSSSLTHQPYSYSKTVAEELAWEIAQKQSRWDLVVVNPGLVFGPSLTKHSDSESLAMMRDMASGMLKMGVPELEFGLVDVRDVAAGHIAAGFTSTATGRHILVSESVRFLEIGQILHKQFGDKYPFPKKHLSKAMVWMAGPFSGLSRKFVSRNVGYPLAFDNSYAKRDLQIDFRPVQQTIVEHFQQMLDDDMLKKPKK